MFRFAWRQCTIKNEKQQHLTSDDDQLKSVWHENMKCKQLKSEWTRVESLQNGIYIFFIHILSCARRLRSASSALFTSLALFVSLSSRSRFAFDSQSLSKATETITWLFWFFVLCFFSFEAIFLSSASLVHTCVTGRSHTVTGCSSHDGFASASTGSSKLSWLEQKQNTRFGNRLRRSVAHSGNQLVEHQIISQINEEWYQE